MTWWHRLWNRRKMEDQLEKELLFHLDQHAADLIARGNDPKEARRQARLALGGPEQVKEDCRDARGTRWLDDLAQDFRYALRTLRNKPGFSTVALLTLALGTGATTVMFTIINSVLLKPLPYVQPDRLVDLQEKTDYRTQLGNLWAFAYPNFLDCRKATPSLDMAAWRWNGGTVSAPGEAAYVDSFQVSANLFSLLGATPVQGRWFRSEEDRPGADPVVVISQSFWQSRYAANVSAIGTPVVFEGKSYTIVGVAPASFRLGGDPADLFTPIGQNNAPFMSNRRAHAGFRVWARLQPHATLVQARTELSVVGQRLADQYPDSNKGRTFIAEPLRPNVDDVRSTLWLLLGAVTLVLLIACANIASLLLARAVSRERELAMRVALGAGRGRLARQCLTESAVIGLSGGLLGIGLAALGIKPFLFFWPGSLPRAEEVRLDWHVLVFTVAVSLASGLIFGLAPALRVPMRELEKTLRAGARTVTGSSRRLHGAFVIAEISFAIVLLVAAGMLGRTLLHFSSLDPGVNIHNVLTTRIALSPGTLSNPQRTRAAWRDLLDRARHVPGVQSIAVVDTVPMREGNNTIGYWTAPSLPPADRQPLVLANCVSPEYREVMGIPLRQGRFLTAQDRAGNEAVAVIDEVMAQQAFPHQDPIGKHLWIGLGNDPLRVVGVVGHVRQWGPISDDSAKVRAQLYYAFDQLPDNLVQRWSQLMSLAVRTAIEPLSVVESLRREVHGPSNDQVAYEINTLEQLARSTLARQRFLLLLFGLFSGLALLLSCIGIYGVLAYLTSQRVPEFGVRIALGASAREVLSLVLRESLVIIAAGAATGIAVSLAAGRSLQRLVEGMQPAGLSIFAITIVVLVTAALFASFLPARRASRIDPMKALRQD